MARREDVEATEALAAAQMLVAGWFEPFGEVDIDPPAVPHPADCS